MKKLASFTRRDFIKQSTLASSALIFPLNSIAGGLALNDISCKKNLEVHLFSKHLQFLNYNDMAEATAEMGFNGVDLTVRPKGHVLPERVTDDLPKAVEALKKFGLQPQMMTTNVTDVNSPEQVTILETASEIGLKHYRMGWLKYPEGESIPQSIETYSHQFRMLEVLNKKLGLYGGYQNHAGNHVGAPIWDLYQILKDTSTKFIGSQYDIRHATVEGGSSWELGLKLIAPYIKTIVIKDFKWGNVDGTWKPINTPLGQGMVNFRLFFSLLEKYEINVPISLHLEYDLGGAEHGKTEINIPQKEVLYRIKKDLEYLKNIYNTIE